MMHKDKEKGGHVKRHHVRKFIWPETRLRGCVRVAWRAEAVGHPTGYI